MKHKCSGASKPKALKKRRAPLWKQSQTHLETCNLLVPVVQNARLSAKLHSNNNSNNNFIYIALIS